MASDIRLCDQPEAAASAGKALLGAPVSFQTGRTLDGLFPASGFPSLIERIARVAHRRGKSQVEGGTLRWENISDLEHLTVTVTPGPGATSLRLEARCGGLAAIVFFAAFFTCMFLAAAFGGFVLGIRSLSGALGLTPAGLLVSYLAGRTLWNRLASQRRQEFTALVEELVDQMRGADAG